MDSLCLIGIGTGSPDHLTRAGTAAIQTADTILIPRKGAGKADLADLRRAICEEVLGEKARDRIVLFDLPVRDTSGDYHAGVEAWHDAIAAAWISALDGRNSGKTALLVWGDPSLYDSTLRIAQRLTPKPDIEVIPGITALQALTAAHAIPLNDINAPVTITTGRQLRDSGWPEGATCVVVMLDGDCSFQSLEAEGLTIWWGAYLGMNNQVLCHGPLTDVSQDIIKTRQAAREAHGWIMDTYLLKRRK